MSRRISFDPKILPIILDIWPPIITAQQPLCTLTEAVGNLFQLTMVARRFLSMSCSMRMRQVAGLGLVVALGKVREIGNVPEYLDNRGVLRKKERCRFSWELRKRD